MRLSDLCTDLPLDPRAAALDVAGLTADSRAVRPGFIFAALKGTQADGHRFIPDAREKGAVAVLSDHVDPALAGEPGRGTAEHLALIGRAVACQGLAQQVVAAVPLPLVVQGGDEQVGPHQVVQHLGRPVHLQRRVAQLERQERPPGEPAFLRRDAELERRERHERGDEPAPDEGGR